MVAMNGILVREGRTTIARPSIRIRSWRCERPRRRRPLAMARHPATPRRERGRQPPAYRRGRGRSTPGCRRGSGSGTVIDLIRKDVPLEIRQLHDHFTLKELLEHSAQDASFVGSYLFYFGMLTLRKEETQVQTAELVVPNQVMREICFSNSSGCRSKSLE